MLPATLLYSLSVAETVLAVWLFATATGIVRFDFAKLLKSLRRRSPEEREYQRLEQMIEQCSLKMAQLSPVNDFAAYFKHDRVRNRLMDEREKIGVEISRQSLTRVMTGTLLLRLAFFVISIIMALHSSHRNAIVLFSISPHVFYPFNFLLVLPGGAAGWWSAGEGEGSGRETEIPVSLFNFALMALWVRRILADRRRETAKKPF